MQMRGMCSAHMCAGADMFGIVLLLRSYVLHTQSSSSVNKAKLVVMLFMNRVMAKRGYRSVHCSERQRP